MYKPCASEHTVVRNFGKRPTMLLSSRKSGHCLCLPDILKKNSISYSLYSKHFIISWCVIMYVLMIITIYVLNVCKRM